EATGGGGSWDASDTVCQGLACTMSVSRHVRTDALRLIFDGLEDLARLARKTPAEQAPSPFNDSRARRKNQERRGRNDREETFSARVRARIPTRVQRQENETEKLSPTWWVEYWHRGRQFRESSQSTNRVVAVRLLHERFEEVARHGRPVSVQAEKVAFEDLVPLLVTNYQINSRKSLDRAQDAITHLREFFGLDRAVEIQPDRIEQYIAKRQCEDAMPATMKYELAVLKRMFTLAVQ